MVIDPLLCSTVMVPAPSHPDVIWLCADKEVFDAACDIAGVSSEFLPMHSTPSGTYNYYVSRLPRRLEGTISVSFPRVL